MDEITQRIVSRRTGGEVEIHAEMLKSVFVVENNNHLLPENYLKVTEEECLYEHWGCTGIYH